MGQSTTRLPATKHSATKTRILFSVFFIFCGFGTMSCGGKTNKKSNTANSENAKPRGPLRSIADSARCVADDAIEVKEDLNQDTAIDVRKLYKQIGKEKVLVCRESDLNYDGVLDMYQFLDDDGQMKRDEVDLDFDGHIDVVSHWSAGKVFKQELDQNSDGYVDTIRHFKDGKIFKTEGDMDQNGHIDYWEYYDGGQLLRIGYDRDGDGKADEWERDKIAQSSEETEQEATPDAENAEDAPQDEGNATTGKDAAPPAVETATAEKEKNKKKKRRKKKKKKQQ